MNETIQSRLSQEWAKNFCTMRCYENKQAGHLIQGRSDGGGRGGVTPPKPLRKLVKRWEIWKVGKTLAGKTKRIYANLNNQK